MKDVLELGVWIGGSAAVTAFAIIYLDRNNDE